MATAGDQGDTPRDLLAGGTIGGARRPLGRTLTAAALAVLAATSGWVALRPEATPAVAVVAERPVWSPDRLPALLAEASGTLGLAGAVDTLLAETPSSCLVAYQGDRLVVSRRPDLALVPASTQKVLVGAAAVSLLGPDFTFETSVVAAAEPRDGVVERLWLVGSGDPLLATPEFEEYLTERQRFADRTPTPLSELAAELVEAGVRSVPGGIAGDDSRYDRTRIVPTWKPNYVTDNEVGPLGALLVDNGFTDFVPPEERAGDPAIHAAAALTRLASDHGIAVAGPPRAAEAPTETVTLAQVRSVPLSEIVAAMVRESDNTAAELLVRELGRRGAGEGSTRAGLRVVVDELAELGIPTDGLDLGDGSGLEVTNTATCATLAGALRVDGVRDWLAVAGRSGTLAKRLVQTPLEGRLAAKTGSINGVTGLIGVVEGRRDLRFAFLANGSFSPREGRVLQDRVVALLANYPAPAERL